MAPDLSKRPEQKEFNFRFLQCQNASAKKDKIISQLNFHQPFYLFAITTPRLQFGLIGIVDFNDEAAVKVFINFFNATDIPRRR